MFGKALAADRPRTDLMGLTKVLWTVKQHLEMDFGWLYAYVSQRLRAVQQWCKVNIGKEAKSLRMSTVELLPGNDKE